MNLGSVRNSGVEIELNYTPIENNNLKWVINWNGTLMKNKILELHPDLKGEMISGSYIYREGESLYQMYLTKYAGVDPDSGEAQYWAKGEDGVEYKTWDWSAAYNSNRQASGDLLPLSMVVSALHWSSVVLISLSSVLISWVVPFMIVAIKLSCMAVILIIWI